MLLDHRLAARQMPNTSDRTAAPTPMPRSNTHAAAIHQVIHYNDAKIQLLDLPGIIEGAAEGKGRGRQVRVLRVRARAGGGERCAAAARRRTSPAQDRCISAPTPLPPTHTRAHTRAHTRR